MRTTGTARITLFAILFVFFLQALSDFIQSIYSFGLLVTAFTIQLAAVLLLFTPLLLLLLSRPPSRRWIAGAAALAVIGRLVEPLLNPAARLVACGISVGAFMLLFPAMMARRPRGAIRGWTLGPALAIALLLSIFFRAAGSSLDITETRAYQLAAWALAAMAGWILWGMEFGGSMPEGTEAAAQHAGEQAHEVSSGRVLGLCIGLAAVVVMIYFSFASPTVIARWTAGPYAGITVVLLLSLVGFIYGLHWRRVLARLSRTVVRVWNALFVLALVLSILPHQISFPTAPAGYPLDAPTAPPWAGIPLYAMLILSPVVFIDFMLYARQISVEGPSIRQLGGGFALAGLFILLMVFLHVFTSIYDYAAPIGPVFRDRFWLVYLIAGLAMALPMLLVSRQAPVAMAREVQGRFPLLIASSIAILTVVAVGLTSPRPAQSEAPSSELRVMTYNIQQSFNKAGAQDLAGQLDAVRRVDPDILGLQESDTARVANGNVDAVRYLADRLNMYSYYGPTTTTGTFGIALLSKQPIRSARTFFMYSAGEQTACIKAEIEVHGRIYSVFVTHLGNGGPMIQLENVLARVGTMPNVLLMGDFNFGPRTEQYARATDTLRDAWLLRWPGGHEIYTKGGEDRIDQVFVSPGMQVLDAEYVPDPASDHPYLYVVVKP